MKCKKLTIETDGTSTGTLVCIDGKPLGMVQSIDFSANTHDRFARIGLIQVVKDKDGKTKTKTVKVRDPKTEKFVEKQEVATESVLIEFEA